MCRVVGKLIAWLLAKSGSNTAAVVRTTVGVTRMNTGSADNVLPDTGSVLFNFRLLPGKLFENKGDRGLVPTRFGMKWCEARLL